jgi:hypothetical protein
LGNVEPTESPLFKYNQTRLKVIEKQAPRDMMVAEGDDTDSEAEQEQVKPKKQKKERVVEGDDDLVEDFELSDEESS